MQERHFFRRNLCEIVRRLAFYTLKEVQNSRYYIYIKGVSYFHQVCGLFGAKDVVVFRNHADSCVIHGDNATVVEFP